MLYNMNALIDGIKASELGKATRKSAQVIAKANLAAWNTTRGEIGKVVGVALKEGEKLTRSSRVRSEQVVENLSEAATEQVARAEKRLQKGVNKVIHDIGLPTADEVDKLSRKVERLSKEVQAKAARRATPRKKATRRPAARKAA